MYRKNNSVPKKEPRGTPKSTVSGHSLCHNDLNCFFIIVVVLNCEFYTSKLEMLLVLQLFTNIIVEILMVITINSIYLNYFLNSSPFNLNCDKRDLQCYKMA